MPECHPAIQFVKLFPEEEIPRIIQNILDCCETLTRQAPHENENSLSRRLFKKLMRFPEYHIGPVVPHWESWIVNVSEEDVAITGRGDILFCGGGVQTYFLVEAKRLFVTFPGGDKRSLLKEYITDGMMRFVTGQYASKMNAGAMLGYVFDKSLGDAKVALSAAVNEEKTKLKITHDGEWQESDIAVNPPVDETRHSLDQGDFNIYHILTDI